MYFLGSLHKPLILTISYFRQSQPQSHQRGASRVFCLLQTSSLSQQLGTLRSRLPIPQSPFHCISPNIEESHRFHRISCPMWRVSHTVPISYGADKTRTEVLSSYPAPCTLRCRNSHAPCPCYQSTLRCQSSRRGNLAAFRIRQGSIF